jgi:hypothetical protein
MFWLIVGALIMVFWILPLVFNVVAAIAGSLFDNGNSGCAWVFIVAVVIVVLALIF